MKTEIIVNGPYGLSATMILENLSPEFLSWAVDYAVRQASNDANAGKAGTQAGREAVTKKWEYLIKGIPPERGRGSGTSISAEDEATWIVVRRLWKATGSPMSTFDKEMKKGNFLDDGHRHIWFDQIKKAMEARSKKILTRESIEGKISDLVKKELETAKDLLLLDEE